MAREPELKPRSEKRKSYMLHASKFLCLGDQAGRTVELLNWEMGNREEQMLGSKGKTGRFKKEILNLGREPYIPVEHLEGN